MTFTYSGNPSASPQDAVRFYLTDTNPSRPFLSDEEIQFLLIQGGSPFFAAILAAETLAIKYATLGHTQVGELSRDNSKIAENFRNIVELLRRRFMILGGVRPSFGGISRAEDWNRQMDTDLKPPFARMGQFDGAYATDFQSGTWGYPDYPWAGWF